MLSNDLKQQLAQYLTHLQDPIVLVPHTDKSEVGEQMLKLLEEIAQMSDKVSIKLYGKEVDAAHHRVPSFGVAKEGEEPRIEFAGLPLGHEFTSLVLAMLHVSGHPPKEEPQILERIKTWDGDAVFETYFSQSCQSCPDVVQALNIMSALNPRITHVAIEGSVFTKEVAARDILAVPTVYCNGELLGQGRMKLEEIANILGINQQDNIDVFNKRDVFDVLVVGGGPAGASAAIYAARKGIKVGVVTERFGGQVLDTVGIENFISVPYTEGVQLGSAMEEHTKSYGVDVMTGQRAVQLRPLPTHTEVDLANGATVRGKTIVLSPGAQWRQTGVPGEQKYRNKGVTYCPHCDGPLFKNKRVVVIGGGNSGVEAAIDLAHTAQHVTVLEYDERLRADDVLQQKLHSLSNASVVVNAHTQEIVGDGKKVTSLVYEDRKTNISHSIQTDGVFVQIGLLPNTQWLKGDVELSDNGEIIIDARGQTSMPGVFAAGDAATTAYKQIVIALGSGSTAALSAFDHLMRQNPE